MAKFIGPSLPPELKKARKAARRQARKSSVALMKSVAESVVNRELETKLVIRRQNGVNFNSRIDSSNDFYSLIPALLVAPAGTQPADYQRVGNNVTPVSCKTHFTVSLYPRLQSVDIIVTLYCLRRKQNKNYLQLLTDVTGIPQILRTGDSSETTSHLGMITDGQLPINTDEYTLLNKKVIRLAKNVGLSNSDATTGMAPSISGMGSKSFTIVTKLPKTLSYKPTPTTGSYPENDAPFWCIAYAHADGTTQGDQLFTDVNVSYTTMMYYKDA